MIDIKNPEKPNRTDAYKYSISSWKRWGEKNDSKVVVLDEAFIDPTVMRPNWYKYHVFDLLESSGMEYDQILYVDSDTIVHPECPNFFDISEGKYCAVHNYGSYDWVFRSIENHSKHIFGGHQLPWERYINSGFQIFNKDHRPFFDAILQFYTENKEKLTWAQNTFSVGIDQPICNFLLDMYKIDMKLLPYEFNGQDIAMHEGLTEDCLFWEFVWVAHFNSIPNNHESKLSNAWMKHAYENVWGKYETD